MYNLYYRYANKVINDIFENYIEMIVPDFCNSYIRFNNSISVYDIIIIRQ